MINVIVYKNGKLLVKYPMQLGGLNYEVNKSEYIQMAKMQLVEDSLAKQDEVDELEYLFSSTL